jgi:outer membrane protein assembly factor BamB
VSSNPSFAEIDNDGKIEVVVGSHDNKVYALNGEDGSLLWSYLTGGGMGSSPSLGDIDNDGKLEVVVGSDDNKIYALNGEDGSLLWSYEPGYYVDSPSLGDIDNDGKLEVVVRSQYGEIYALNGEDGSLLWWYDGRWYVDYRCFPSIGDIDNDGKLEVVIPDDVIYALNGEDGTLLWKSPENICVMDHLSLGDIDNDGRLEIVGGGCSYNEIYTFNGEDGSLSWSYKKIGGKNGESCLSTPSLGDINNDGRLDMVVVSSDGRIFAVSTNSPVPPPHLLPWPKFKHDVKNTGLYTGDPYPPW